MSIHQTIQWVEVLLAKGRFSKSDVFSNLAFQKLESILPALPNFDHSLAFIKVRLLLAETYTQLNNSAESDKILQDLLTQSEAAGHQFGQIQSLNKLAELKLLESSPEEALDYAIRSRQHLLQESNIPLFNVRAENQLILSKTYLRLSDSKAGYEHAKSALKISMDKGHREIAMSARLLLGIALVDQGSYSKAMPYLLEAREESNWLNYRSLNARSNLYIGIVYNQVFHYPRALGSLLNAKDDSFYFFLPIDQVLLLNYLGKSFFLSGQEPEAESCFEQAVTLAKQHSFQSALAFSYAYLGRLNTRKKDTKNALIYAKRVNNILKKIGEADGGQINLLNLGDVHCQLEKYSEAIKLVSRGIAAAKRMKDGLSEIRGYQIMAEIFRKKKDYKSAVMYQMIYTKFYEDFYQRNERQAVLEIEHQFTIDQLNKTIKDLKSNQHSGSSI